MTTRARSIVAGLVVALTLGLSLVAAVYLLLFVYLLLAVNDYNWWTAPYTWFLICLAFGPVYAFAKATKIRHSGPDSRLNAWKGIAAMVPVVANFGYWYGIFSIYETLPLVVTGPLSLAFAIIAGFVVIILFDRYAPATNTPAVRRDTPT